MGFRREGLPPRLNPLLSGYKVAAGTTLLGYKVAASENTNYTNYLGDRLPPSSQDGCRRSRNPGGSWMGGEPRTPSLGRPKKLFSILHLNARFSGRD